MDHNKYLSLSIFYYCMRYSQKVPEIDLQRLSVQSLVGIKLHSS